MIARWLRLVLSGQIVLAGLVAWLVAHHFKSALALSVGPAFGIVVGIVVGVVVAFVAHPIAIALDFAITRHFRSPIPPALQIGFRAGLRLYLLEVASSMRSFSGANPFLCHRRAPPPVGAKRAQPILFVHGYFCNRGIWGPFMRAAALKGYRCEALTLASPFGDIDAYAPEIEAAVVRLLDESESDELILVAHSMGGLAARAWMRRYGSSRLRRLVTLATPHCGTIMAALGHGGNVAQMRLHSAWLRVLDSSETLSERAKTSCFFSYHDNIVAPQTNATLAGAENVGLHGIGHVRLVYDPSVWERVFRCLENDSNAPVTSPQQGPLESVL